MQNNLLIYIGSPYSHPDKAVMEENFKRVSQLAADLCAEGKVVFSPITYGHTLLNFREMPHTWEFWQNFCINFLDHADRLLVYKMPGWENSKGLAAEIEYANENNIPIEYVDYTEPNIDFDPYEIVLSCETAEELSAAILRLANNGQIEGKIRRFDAVKMASFVQGAINRNLPMNVLTRKFGIRRQAIYIQYYQDLNS